MKNKTFQEKMDELLLTTLREMSRELEAYGYLDSKNYLPEKREAITSLTKELVAEAKPKEMDSFYEKPIVDEFEQNLLKELEEV